MEIFDIVLLEILYTTVLKIQLRTKFGFETER